MSAEAIRNYNLKILNLLKEARETISKPENWVQGSFACDDEGALVDPRSKKARCFCAMGALQKHTLSQYPQLEIAFAAARRLIKALPDGWHFVTEYNDATTTTHEEVLALFDRAIDQQELEIEGRP